VGLLHWVSLPKGAGIVATFLLMDFSFYYWHRLNHQVPALWRFHNVHHVDPDLDVSTALRFHFGEIALSSLFRIAQLAAFGISPVPFLAFETCFTIAAEFHHSNWRLPFQVERFLNAVFVTPRMHGIHHSVREEETNSNYSTIFSWWDRLNGSFRMMREAQTITIGVPGYRNVSDQRILRLLMLPFQRQRATWQRPRD
jgi:sterol desaturase/sphingolipid hydroxylase (fatty acid hydroxylase superfamily)